MPLSTYAGVNGCMVPGFLDKHEGVPQPVRVANKISEKFGVSKLVGDVETEVLSRVEAEPEAFFDRGEAITEQQLDVCLYLMGEEEWGLFMTVFMGVDRVQHFFWKCVDPDHPEYVWNEHSLRFKAYYQKLDEVTGRLLEHSPEDAVTILLSDHGFCPVSKEVILNNYLQEFGFLESVDGKIDLEKSRAVSYGYGDIWLNVRGREPAGVIGKGEEYEKTRRTLIDALEGLEIDGVNPIKEVRRREDVYWGPYLNEAPDLITIFQVGWQAARRPEIEIGKRRDMRYVNDKPKWSGGHDGTHDPIDVPGILGFLGPSLLKMEKPFHVPLWDLAPTILNAMNLRVPKDMDGEGLLIINR